MASRSNPNTPSSKRPKTAAKIKAKRTAGIRKAAAGTSRPCSQTLRMAAGASEKARRKAEKEERRKRINEKRMEAMRESVGKIDSMAVDVD